MFFIVFLDFSFFLVFWDGLGSCGFSQVRGGYVVLKRCVFWKGWKGFSEDKD